MWKGSSFSGGRKDGKAPERPNFVQTCNLLSQYIKEKGSLKDLNLEIGGKVESLEAIVKPGSTYTASDSAKMNPLINKGKSAHLQPQPQPSIEQPTSREQNPCIDLEEDASNKASTSKDGSKAEPKTAQLTIFYGGRVLVFDEFPGDKVRELVSFAKKGSSQMSYGIFPNITLEKPNPNGAVASTSNARDGLPPRPQPISSHKPAGILSNGCKEKANPSSSGPIASSSRSEEQCSSPPEANGSELPIARRSSLHRFLEKRKDRAAVRGPYPLPNHQDQAGSSSSKCDEQLELKL